MYFFPRPDHLQIHNLCKFIHILETKKKKKKKKCSIGNIYFPQSRWKETRIIAFNELEQWLSSHNNDNHPAILVGDFNMSFERIRKYIANHS